MNKKIRKTFLMAALVVAAASGSPAYASNEDMLKLLRVLRDNGTIDSKTADMLKESVLDGSKVESKSNGNSVKISLKGGKLKFKTADGDFKFGIHGRLMADYAWYNDDKTEMGSGAEIRRARIALKGTAWKNYHYTVMYDFVNGESSSSGHLRTTDLRYTGVKNWQLQIGHFHQPFGMEQQSSSKTITFMERALPDIFTPSRDIGLAAQYVGGMWRAKAGLFSIVNLDGDDPVATGDAAWELSGRLNVTPFMTKSNVLHLGIAGTYRELEDDTIRFRARPETHVTDTRLIDTGTIAGAESLERIGLEAGFKHGSFSLMGEYMFASVDRGSIGSDLDFDGYYVQGSYVLTGESRKYKRKTGTWGGIKPKNIVGKGGWGTWEIAGRFSSLDLTDGTTIGGEEDNLSLAVNWYLTPTVRLNANYVRVLEVDRPGNANDENEPSLFQIRAQYSF